MNLIFEFARQRNYIDVNPVPDVKIKKKPITYAEIERTEDKFLNHDELSLLIKEMRNNQSIQRYADCAEFLSLTGLRFGELMALTEDKYKKTYILVDATIDYSTKKKSNGHKTTTKNEKLRKVDLSKRAIEIIEDTLKRNELEKMNNRYNDRGFIFSSIHGNPVGIANFNETLTKYEKKCKINKKISSHIFRHTHISILAELGINLKAIMQRVGHTDKDVTLDIYTHVTDKMSKDIIEKLNSFEV